MLKYDLKTPEDFMKFVIENKISNIRIFKLDYPEAYNKFTKLISKKDRDKIIKPIRQDYSMFTPEDIENFLKENNISSITELRSRTGAYKRYMSFSEEEKNKIVFPKKIIVDISNLDLSKLECMKKFLLNYNITRRIDLKYKFYSVYEKFKKFPDNIQNELLPNTTNNRLICSNYVSEEEILRFVEDKGITSRKDLSAFYPNIHRNFKNLPEESQDRILLRSIADNTNINTVEEIEEYLKKHRITSRKELGIVNPGLYLKFLKLSEEDRDKLLKKIVSFGEDVIKKLFMDEGIKFETEKCFPDLIDVGFLRYDFYLPDYNILVEVDGRQHYDQRNGYYTESTVLHDKMKVDYAKKKGIPLFHITFAKAALKRCGYFTDVLTDTDTLIEEIRKIGMTNQSTN